MEICGTKGYGNATFAKSAERVTLPKNELKDFLEFKVNQYNTPAFIEDDPISVPHRYLKREDIEIAGILAATISWGNRKIITRNAHKMLDLLGESPFDFVMHHSDTDLHRLDNFVHRTFNGSDYRHFIKALRHIYITYGGPEPLLKTHETSDSYHQSIHYLHKAFFEIPHEIRTRKHVADPLRGSVAKRLYMCMRWFVRKDSKGVDLGIWESLSPSRLSCPLDVHSGNVARKLGLIESKGNTLKALGELDAALRGFDREDPVKYDFALFGLGMFEGF